MQEKIEELLHETIGGSWFWMGGERASEMVFQALAGKIATLFERKVIWEGEGRAKQLDDLLIIRMAPDEKVSIDRLWTRALDEEDGQRVRMIVEDIEKTDA